MKKTACISLCRPTIDSRKVLCSLFGLTVVLGLDYDYNHKYVWEQLCLKVHVVVSQASIHVQNFKGSIYMYMYMQ